MAVGIRQPDLTPELSRELLYPIVDAIAEAARTDMSALAAKLPRKEERDWFSNWPGEHYAFLAALTLILRPRLVWDIGTYHGASALAMATHSGSVVTNDICALSDMDGSYGNLELEFENVRQCVGSLADEQFFALHRESLAEADLVVVDGPKDGLYEYEVVPRLVDTMASGSILVLDDIRFTNMQELWASLQKPRIDIGCFGHWSGTGIVFL